MRLSTRSTYGMRALVELALASGQGPVSATRIAKRQDLSVAYLEQLLHRLKRHGIVSSVRGPRGGYALALDPRRITMGEVVRILDGNGGTWDGPRWDSCGSNATPGGVSGGSDRGLTGREANGKRAVVGFTKAAGGGDPMPPARSVQRLSRLPFGPTGREGASHGQTAPVRVKADGVRDASYSVAPRHAQWVAEAIWRCVHERLTQSLRAVTLQDLCDEVRSIAGAPLGHRYVFHI